MMSNPRVSVLMTLYNKGPFVADAIRSVLASTYSDLEILVVDDASTDGGADTVRAIDDRRIRLLTSERNTGRPAAANRGYDAAHGEFIAILDADDIMLPTRIERQVAFLDAHPEIGAVGSSLRAFGDKDEMWHWPADDRTARGKMLFGDPACYGTVLVRRAIIEQHALRCDESWRHPGMDFLFLLTWAPHLRFANIQEPLTLYRVGAQNMRHGRDPLADKARIYQRQFEMWGIPGSVEDVRLQLMLHRLFRKVPDRHEILALAGWIDRLVAHNRAAGLFPADVFEAELLRRFKRLFFIIADHRFLDACAHMSAGAGWTMGNMRYLLQVSAKRMFGWKANDMATPETDRP